MPELGPCSRTGVSQQDPKKQKKKHGLQRAHRRRIDDCRRSDLWTLSLKVHPTRQWHFCFVTTTTRHCLSCINEGTRTARPTTVCQWESWFGRRDRVGGAIFDRGSHQDLVTKSSSRMLRLKPTVDSKAGSPNAETAFAVASWSPGISADCRGKSRIIRAGQDAFGRGGGIANEAKIPAKIDGGRHVKLVAFKLLLPVVPDAKKCNVGRVALWSGGSRKVSIPSPAWSTMVGSPHGRSQRWHPQRSRREKLRSCGHHGRSHCGRRVAEREAATPTASVKDQSINRGTLAKESLLESPGIMSATYRDGKYNTTHGVGNSTCIAWYEYFTG